MTLAEKRKEIINKFDTEFDGTMIGADWGDVAYFIEKALIEYGDTIITGLEDKLLRDLKE